MIHFVPNVSGNPYLLFAEPTDMPVTGFRLGEVGFSQYFSCTRLERRSNRSAILFPLGCAACPLGVLRCQFLHLVDHLLDGRRLLVRRILVLDQQPLDR